MTALAKSFNYIEYARSSMPYDLTNALQVYKGSLLAVSPSTGYAVAWANTAGLLFKGISRSKVLGDTSKDVNNCVVDERGVILSQVTVTGASAITDREALVYAGDDNAEASLTLTPTVAVGAIGRVTRWYSSTTCDVKLFTPEEYAARETGGAGSWVFSFLAATIADGNLITGFIPGFAGRIVKMDAFCTAAVTTAAKDSDLNLEIDAVDVTGGVVALDETYSLGGIEAGTTITAGNHFSKTGVIDLEASSTTSFIEGSFDVVVHYVAD